MGHINTYTTCVKLCSACTQNTRVTRIECTPRLCEYDYGNHVNVYKKHGQRIFDWKQRYSKKMQNGVSFYLWMKINLDINIIITVIAY